MSYVYNSTTLIRKMEHCQWICMHTICRKMSRSPTTPSDEKTPKYWPWAFAYIKTNPTEIQLQVGRASCFPEAAQIHLDVTKTWGTPYCSAGRIQAWRKHLRITNEGTDGEWWERHTEEKRQSRKRQRQVAKNKRDKEEVWRRRWNGVRRREYNNVVTRRKRTERSGGENGMESCT